MVDQLIGALIDWLISKSVDVADVLLYCLQLMGVVPELRPANSQPFQPPKSCPSCNTPLQPRAAHGDPNNLVCSNTFSCPAQMGNQIQHFVSKCTGVGLGHETTHKLIEAGRLSSISDLFKMTKVGGGVGGVGGGLGGRWGKRRREGAREGERLGGT